MSQQTTLLEIKPLVVVAGMFQRGKSTLINGLVGHPVAEVGEGLATTHGWTRYRASASAGIEAVSPTGQVMHSWPNVPANILQHVDLADVPGFGAGGPEGPADEAAADEALAKADIVLYIADQTGLGGDVERTVLKRVSSHQPIVIALQNVFVPCSVAKRAAWLGLLEKQMADNGVFAWRLHSGARALSINALRLAEGSGAIAVDKKNSAVLPVPAEKALHHRPSGVEQLIAFLIGNDSNSLGAADLTKLRRATVAWATRRNALLTSHLQNLIKPCL